MTEPLAKSWNYVLTVDAGGAIQEPRNRYFAYEPNARLALSALSPEWTPYAEIRDKTGRVIAKGSE